MDNDGNEPRKIVKVSTIYLDGVSHIYKWTIDDFSHCVDEMGEYLSRTISPSGDDEQWEFQLYPSGENIQIYEDHVSLSITMTSKKRESVCLKYSISIMNDAKEIDYTKVGEKEFVSGESEKVIFISREALFKDSNKLLPNDNLTLIFDMFIVNNSINVSRRNVEVHQCRLSDELAGLLENEKFSDVIMVAEGKEIQAHKNILAARSPVFAAMFEHEMEERKRNRVDITDVDHEVLREMLRYIYTGRAPNIAKVAEDLLVAADKYALYQLKAMCEETLALTLSVETAVDTLMLADLHSANKLKTHTINFINTKPLEVMKTAGWKNVVTSHSHILEEVYHALVMTTKVTHKINIISI